MKIEIPGSLVDLMAWCTSCDCLWINGPVGPVPCWWHVGSYSRTKNMLDGIWTVHVPLQPLTRVHFAERDCRPRLIDRLVMFRMFPVAWPVRPPQLEEWSVRDVAIQRRHEYHFTVERRGTKRPPTPLFDGLT